MQVNIDHINLIGSVAGILTTASFVPQILKVYRTKHVRDISIVMYSIFIMGVGLWTVYGFLINALPVIIANLTTLVFCFLIVYAKFKFGKNQ